MLKIIQQNGLYFSLFLLSFFGVFIWQMRNDDLAAFFFFSDHRSVFGDLFFKNWTMLGEAAPYIAFTGFFLIISEKQWAWRFLMAGFVVAIPTFLFKELLAVPRPAVVLEQLGLLSQLKLVADVSLLTGDNSFPSGHTASAFCVWTLLAFRFMDNRIAQFFIFIIALLVAVSRVYLIQHYPQDTLFGSCIGVASAIFIEYMFRKKEAKDRQNIPKPTALHTVEPYSDIEKYIINNTHTTTVKPEVETVKMDSETV